MHISVLVWLLTFGAFVAIMIFDLVIVDVRHVDFGTRQALTWVGFYFAVAAGVALLVDRLWGAKFAGEFVAGYVTEYSLSVDNLFVFALLMSSFAVPNDLRHRVLLYGIVIALALRTVLILIGGAAVQRFSAVFYLFAAVLLWTAWKVWKGAASDQDPEGNAVVRFASRHLPVTSSYHSHHLTAEINGRRFVTPLALAVLAIGTTDLLFALDSIPAVYGLTSQPYIAFLVNACALMGLRQLFFLLDSVLGRLVYLNRGLAVILAFIAFKLLLEAIAATTPWKVPQVSVLASLGFIAAVLVITAITSTVSVRRAKSRKSSIR